MTPTGQHDETTAKDISSLKEELRHFHEEKEKVRGKIGQIGGAQSRKRDRWLNISFLSLLVVLVSLDITKHYNPDLRWIPPILSLEIGVLLVSLKIIWMIYKQAKVEHFQFWILNSIEFRLTEISKRLSEMEKRDKGE